MNIAVGSLVWGCELGLVTLSLSLSFAVIGYANFALIELTGVGAYLALTLPESMPLPLAAIAAAAACGVLAVILNATIFRRLGSASVAAKMLVSIAVALVIRALVQLAWGVQGRFFDVDPRPVTEIGGVLITRSQIAVVVATAIALVAFQLLLHHTRAGRALRSTAESPTLAEIRGISSQCVITGAWFLAGSLAGLGGILFGLDTYVQPAMGFSLIVPVFAAAVVGGLGSLSGAVAGAFLLSLFQNLAVNVDWGGLVGAGTWLIETQYKPAVAMVALVATLLIRPHGLFGRPAP